MGVSTEKFIRKPLYVDAVRVTTGNFDDIASWCQGEIQTEEIPSSGTIKKFIHVRVHNPKNPRQRKAYVGDWLLYTERGYKVYTNKAFHAAFDLVGGEEEKIDHAGRIDLDKPLSEEEETAITEAEIEAVPTQGGPPLQVGDAVHDHTTPQGEPHEYVEATPQAIADVVNEQQPVGGTPDVEVPEIAADKRVLTEEEQAQMGPDEVREAVSSGDVVLAQDMQ